MKKINYIFLLIITLSLFLLPSCRKNADSSDGNAIYYWRTTFTLNGYERDFLKKHNVSKMYVRFFDVVDYYSEGAVPDGTLIFLDSVPKDIEIVPTVFITSDAIRNYKQFSSKMFERIKAMAEVNDVTFNEIQIDCDWTESSKDSYFEFMKEFRQLLKKNDIKLSATIRLFQLQYEVPDADYGVLMCYNTGEIDNWETSNSIINPGVIEAYVSNLKDYKLPLSIALPQFSWDVVFNAGKSMLYIDYSKRDYSDKNLFKKIGENKYERIDVEADADNYYRYSAPHYFRHEEANISTILKVKDNVLGNMSQKPVQMVIYQLDSANLSNLTDNDVEKIYR